MRLAIFAAFLGVAIVLFESRLAFAGVTEPEDPVVLVNDFHQALVQSMQAGAYDARKIIVAPAITHYFSVRTISRISLGLNWRTLSDTEQQSVAALMYDLIVSTYTSRFKKYDGHVFSVLGTSSLGKNRMRVKSTLTTKKEIVSLDYQLINSTAGWQIYDIVANGVSDLSLKRSNYAAIYKSGGLAAVQEELKINIQKNETRDSK